MTGLSVLYASQAAEEPEWTAMPDRAKVGRLREVYWARRAESKLRERRFGMGLHWRLDRHGIGRRSDEPGDGFVYLVDMVAPVEEHFEWLEVTEVFTTVKACRIEGAMRAWNGIPGKQVVDFDDFRKSLTLGRPSRLEQRKAADKVIAQVEKKLAKASYRELLDKYGYLAERLERRMGAGRGGLVDRVDHVDVGVVAQQGVHDSPSAFLRAPRRAAARDTAVVLVVFLARVADVNAEAPEKPLVAQHIHRDLCVVPVQHGDPRALCRTSQSCPRPQADQLAGPKVVGREGRVHRPRQIERGVERDHHRTRFSRPGNRLRKRRGIRGCD